MGMENMRKLLFYRAKFGPGSCAFYLFFFLQDHLPMGHSVKAGAWCSVGLSSAQQMEWLGEGLVKDMAVQCVPKLMCLEQLWITKQHS